MNYQWRRKFFLGVALTAFCLLVLSLFLLLSRGGSIAFFLSPTEVMHMIREGSLSDHRMRLGGTVEPGSVERTGEIVRFRISDGRNVIAVFYSGILPDLFAEGEDAVVEGVLGKDRGKDRIFIADQVMAKHGETYRPLEAAAEPEGEKGRPLEGEL